MWKLGFNAKVYPPIYEKFWHSQEKLLSIIALNSKINDVNQEEIRSIAVNYFVCLEQILDYTLSFLTWLFFKDHWMDTKFYFNLPKAREFMSTKLNDFQENKEEYIEYDPSGKNSLFNLIYGFSLLTEKCKQHIENQEGTLRPDHEIPYVAKSPVLEFHFLHREFLDDCQSSDVNRVLERLKEVNRLLNIGNVTNIRNRIDHHRKDFPSNEEISEMCKHCGNAISILEESGLSPKVYYLYETSDDQFGRTKHIFKDYKGNQIQLEALSEYLTPPSLQPIIVSSLHLKDSTKYVTCEIREESSFSKYWEGYPKRRRRQRNIEIKGLPNEYSSEENESS